MGVGDIAGCGTLMTTVAESLLDARGDPWSAESREVGGLAEKMSVEM